MIRQTKAMDAVWSREFLVALLVFLVPTAVAAGFAYRWIRRSSLCRKRVASLPESLPKVSDKSEAAAPARPQSIHDALEKLKQRLVEFRTLIQRSRSALDSLQECDSRFTSDLQRARETLRRPISQATQSCDARGVSSAA